MKSPFFIVCSASSGSTLLSIILDKHSKIAIGPELYLFNKDKIYRNFNKIKKNFKTYLDKGILSNIPILTRNFFYNLDSYFVEKKELIQFMNNSSNLNSFLNKFWSSYLKKRDKEIFGEKTGSNVYFMKEILGIYPDAKIVHLIRDGRDSTCSIYKRTNSIYDSASHWFLQNTAATLYENLDNYLLVKYENLVHRPEIEIKRIVNFLGFKYEKKMLSNGANRYWCDVKENNFHENWNNSPLGLNINNSSVGKYKKQFTEDMKNIFWNLRLTNYGKRRLGLKKKINPKNLMKKYNYSDIPVEYNKTKIANKFKRLKLEFKRVKYQYKINKKMWVPFSKLR